jgi:hypothetical protein
MFSKVYKKKKTLDWGVLYYLISLCINTSYPNFTSTRYLTSAQVRSWVVPNPVCIKPLFRSRNVLPYWAGSHHVSRAMDPMICPPF